jgi:hypothetical protein
VADILESLGGILTGDVKQNLFTTTKKKKSNQLLILRDSHHFPSLRVKKKKRGVQPSTHRQAR